MNFKTLLTTTIITSVIATSAQAFDVVVTSTLNGPQGVMINNISAEAAKSDIVVVAKQTGGCGEAVSYFNTTTAPVGIIWSNSMYGNSAKSKQNCIIDVEKSTPVMVAYAPYDICVRAGYKLKPGATLLFGNTKFNPQVSQLEHINTNKMNITFKNVTYSGSGTTLTGLVNGDIDVAMIATSVASAGVKLGTIECPYSTGSSVHGQVPFSTFAEPGALSEFSLGMMLFVRNMSADDVAKLQSALANTVQTLTAQDMVNVTTDMSKPTFDYFMTGAKLQVGWK